MNVLGLVFSLLLILSYGFYASWNRHIASVQVRNTYVGHQKANRKLLNRYQSEIYKKFRSKTSPSESEEVFSEKKQTVSTIKPEANRECAKINLRPLIQEGKEKHPLLYELTAKMLRTFYSPLCKQNKFEYRLLNTLLEKAKTQSLLPLEKLDLGEWQTVYYKMLKGTKEWNLKDKKGYPPLLEYVKVENQEQKICIFHAHPDLITVLFNQEIAAKLYEEIHKEGAPLLTQELVERICSESHLIGINRELFLLLELGNPHHEEFKKTLFAKDSASGVSLRKSTYLK